MTTITQHMVQKLATLLMTFTISLAHTWKALMAGIAPDANALVTLSSRVKPAQGFVGNQSQILTGVCRSLVTVVIAGLDSLKVSWETTFLGGYSGLGCGFQESSEEPDQLSR